MHLYIIPCLLPADRRVPQSTSASNKLTREALSTRALTHRYMTSGRDEDACNSCSTCGTMAIYTETSASQLPQHKMGPVPTTGRGNGRPPTPGSPREARQAQQARQAPQALQAPQLHQEQPWVRPHGPPESASNANAPVEGRPQRPPHVADTRQWRHRGTRPREPKRTASQLIGDLGRHPIQSDAHAPYPAPRE